MNPPTFLRALSSRNFRLYMGGQCVSLIGNWMTTTASMWLVYRLSASPFAVGLVVFCNFFPILPLAPFAGVLIDRTDALKIMRATQVLLMAQAGTMAAFTLSGHMTVNVLIWLSLIQGVINAFDFSCRQALVYELAGNRDLVENVVALNSITFNLTRLIGPAIAGFVIAAIGAGYCFAVDAVSYLAVISALMKIRLAPKAPRTGDAHPLTDLKEGAAYAWRHPVIRRILAMVPVMSLVGFAHTILAPVLARTDFHGDARTLGFMLSAVGAGSLVAGGFMSTRESGPGLGRVVTVGSAITGLALAAIGLSPGLSLALVAFAAAGGGISLVMIATNTWLQMLVEHDKRGRVMSLYQMTSGIYPIGGLVVGGLAERWGARPAMCICAGGCVAAAIVFGQSGKKRSVAGEAVAE